MSTTSIILQHIDAIMNQIQKNHRHKDVLYRLHILRNETSRILRHRRNMYMRLRLIYNALCSLRVSLATTSRCDLSSSNEISSTQMKTTIDVVDLTNE